MKQRSRFLGFVTALGVGTILLTGCTGGNTSPAAASHKILNVEANTVPQFQKNFNPYSPTVTLGTKGLIYEPLIVYSAVNAKGTPWLATSLTWGDGGMDATIKIRDGVKWSDGKPFTAKDVAFSFNLLPKFPAVNTTALPVTSATANGNTVKVMFSKKAYAYEQSLGNFTPVPEHIWSSVNAATYTNEKPVGTGPYTLGTFSAQLLSYKKNVKYWQADKIKVEQVNYPAATPQTFVSNLSAGKFDWAGGFVANIDKIYVAKDPAHNKYWFPGDGLVNLVTNVQKAPFNDVKLRQAMSMAIDRNVLSKTAEGGKEPAAHPTGLVLPALKGYLTSKYSDAKFSYNAAKANSMLDAAGYTKGTDGIRVAPDGTRLSFNLTVPSGYTDWVTITKLLQSQFAKVGIDLKPQGVSSQSWSAALHSGTYEMTIASAALGTGAYALYRSFMSKELSAPAGQPASTNYERWEDPATEQLFADYQKTSDPAAQKKAIQGLEGIVVDKLPVIPMLQSSNWFEYRTSNFVGWPTAKEPYAMPAPYMFPDNLLVLTRLSPVSK